MVFTNTVEDVSGEKTENEVHIQPTFYKGVIYKNKMEIASDGPVPSVATSTLIFLQKKVLI